jgi:hypothetical protein
MSKLGGLLCLFAGFIIGFVAICLGVLSVVQAGLGTTTSSSSWKRSSFFKPSLFISMTTLPDRLKSDYFKRVVTRLLDEQDYIDKNYKIVLNIPHVWKRKNVSYVVPDWVVANHRIVLNRCDDRGPVTKIIETCKVVPPFSIVIVVDDDIIYQKFLVSGLVDSFWKDPAAVSSYSIEFDDWTDKKGKIFGSSVPEGFGGVVMAGTVVHQIKDAIKMPDSCFSVDDQYLAFVYKKLGIKVNRVKDGVPWNYSTDSIYDHPPWFELNLHTDRKRIKMECLSDLLNEKKLEIKKI